MAFATVEDVTARLGWALTTDEQARVSAFLDDVSVLIEDYCGLDFSLHTDESFNVSATCGIKLSIPRRYRHGLSVTSVAFEDGVALTDWEFYDNALWRDCGWDDGHTVTVTGSWGYSTPPAALKVAATAEVIRWMAQTPGLSMERTGEREVMYATASSPQSLSEAAKYALRKYRPTVGTLSLQRGESCW